MELYKEHINKDLCLGLATSIGRAGHSLKSACQNYVKLMHPEMLTVDNIAGNIEGEVRGLKANLFLFRDIRHSIVNIARASAFLGRITRSDFFKDSSVRPDVLAYIQSLADLMLKATKAIEFELMTAQIKHSQSVFEEKLCDYPAAKPVELAALSRFGNAPGEVPAVMTPDQAKQVAEQAGEYLGNLAHMTQETVDLWVNHNDLKALAGKVINLSGQVENEARNCIIFARRDARVDVNGVKKAMENAKAKVAEQRKALEEQKVWEANLREKLLTLYKVQDDAIARLELVASKA